MLVKFKIKSIFTVPIIGITFFFLLNQVVFGADAGLTIGSASGQPSSNVDLPVTFAMGSSGIAALQFDLITSSYLSYISVTAGAAAMAASKTAVANAVSPTLIRVVIYGLNQNIINSGQISTVRFSILSGTPTGTLPISITNIVAASPDGNGVFITGTDGSIIVNSFSADFNSDGRVNSVDFGIMMSYWGSTAKPMPDINKDGFVNSVDFGILLSRWTG